MEGTMVSSFTCQIFFFGDVQFFRNGSLYIINILFKFYSIFKISFFKCNWDHLHSKTTFENPKRCEKHLCTWLHWQRFWLHSPRFATSNSKQISTGKMHQGSQFQHSILELTFHKTSHPHAVQSVFFPKNSFSLIFWKLLYLQVATTKQKHESMSVAWKSW